MPVFGTKDVRANRASNQTGQHQIMRNRIAVLSVMLFSSSLASATEVLDHAEIQVKITDFIHAKVSVCQTPFFTDSGQAKKTPANCKEMVLKMDLGCTGVDSQGCGAQSHENFRSQSVGRMESVWAERATMTYKNTDGRQITLFGRVVEKNSGKITDVLDLEVSRLPVPIERRIEREVDIIFDRTDTAIIE